MFILISSNQHPKINYHDLFTLYIYIFFKAFLLNPKYLIPRNQIFVKGKGRMDTMFVDEILFMKTEHKISLNAKITVILTYIHVLYQLIFLKVYHLSQEFIETDREKR